MHEWGRGIIHFNYYDDNCDDGDDHDHDDVDDDDDDDDDNMFFFNRKMIIVNCSQVLQSLFTLSNVKLRLFKSSHVSAKFCQV